MTMHPQALNHSANSSATLRASLSFRYCPFLPATVAASYQAEAQ